MNKQMLDEAPPRGGVVTASYLKRRGACVGRRMEFQKMWPDGMPLTRANVVKTVVSLYGMAWVLNHLMSQEALTAYWDRLREEREKHQQKLDDLRNKYSQDEVTEAQYNRRTKAASQTFNRRKAVVLCDILGIE